LKIPPPATWIFFGDQNESGVGNGFAVGHVEAAELPEVDHINQFAPECFGPECFGPEYTYTYILPRCTLLSADLLVYSSFQVQIILVKNCPSF
jgi:hypothetical protein